MSVNNFVVGLIHIDAMHDRSIWTPFSQLIKQPLYISILKSQFILLDMFVQGQNLSYFRRIVVLKEVEIEVMIINRYI